MEQMDITSAQYVTNIMGEQNDSINAVIDGQLIFVPLNPANRHYAEILRQVEAGTLVIQEADNGAE